MAKITKINLGGTEYDVGTDTTYSAGSGITMNGTQISVNGAPRVWSRGNVTAETGASLPAVTGMSMAQVYNNGYPIPYGNIITLYGTGCGQILVGWSGTNGGRASVYVRSKRDVQSAEWSPWYELKDSGNLTVVSKTAAGLCPALPNEDTTTKYLRQDGTWVVPPNTTYSAATQSAAGLMSADDKKKLDGIATGAQVNSVTGVKGNGESTYRTGNVNITKANVELGNVANALQVYDKANVSGNMNQAAGFRNAIGMISLSGTDAKINPNGQTSWHHFINMSYAEQSGSNMWQTQIAVKAGTTDPWIRSRAGGAIVDGTAWMADWVRILTGSNWSNVITKTALGIGNVENLAQGKAIKSITRSGTTFTYTCLDGTTGTFTQQDNNTTYSAGAGLVLEGTTFRVSCPRVNAQDSKTEPGANTVKIEEYANNAPNTPSAHWYHIITMQGADTNYCTQLALGMTTTAAYYRVKNANTWSAWQSLINTNTTYTAGAGLALSGTTFKLRSCYAKDNTTDAASKPWHKFASVTINSGAGDRFISFIVYESLTGANRGILQFRCRVNSSVSDNESATLAWLVKWGLYSSRFVWRYVKNSGSITYELWCSITQWHTITFVVQDEGNGAGEDVGTVFTLHNTTAGEASYTAGNGGGTSTLSGEVLKVNGHTVEKDVPSNAVFTDTNTWRGIQDNLTSSTNTTESLSAKQGYLLANGSARDNSKLPLGGGTLTGSVTLAGVDLRLGTPGSSSNDSGDISWHYGNGNEKCRIWTGNNPTIAVGPNYRIYKSDGTELYNGRLATMGDLPSLGANTFKVTRALSVATTTNGYWAAMCNSIHTGTPTLPTAGQWWHVISMDWSGDDANNWISQLAVATQENNGVWWRRNTSGGTSINSSTWNRLAEGDANGNAKNALTVNGLTVQTAVPANAVFTDTKYNFSGASFVSGDKDTASHDANAAIANGVYYYTSNGPATTLGASTNDGALFVQRYNDTWVTQIAQDYRNGRLFVRGKNNGTWQEWKRIANYDEIIGDTKNTAGSTDTSSKIFLIGATSQAANPQTYSHDTAYVGTDGCLYSGGAKVLTAHQDISGKVSKSGDTMSGTLKNTYNAQTLVNGLTNAALTMSNTSGYNSFICCPTKNGNISFSVHTSADDIVRLGYGERGRTDNSFVRQISWNAANGNLQVDMINGVAVGSSPKFTDTNTWRGIQDNLTSDSTTDSLSAAQGKALANGSARDNTKLPLSGGTMTGQLKTSFKESVAMGTYNASATTIPDLCNELRFSSGAAGSVNIQTAYTLSGSGITIPTGWYNFLWIPHRSGGVNGAASRDNCNYGSMILSGMTLSGCYMIRYSNSVIAELRNLYANTTYDVVSKTAAGLCPTLPNETTTTKYLRQDGSWQVPAASDLANATGTLPIAHGGTGATTRLGALQNLTSENVGTSSQYFLTITTNWAKGGYCSVNDAKTVLGLGNKADLASPTFTGTPKAPTAASGTNSTQIATTEFVNNATSEFFAKSLGRPVLISGGVLTQASGQQIWQRSQAVVMLTDGTKITVIPQNCNSQDIDIYKKSDGTQYIWYNGSLSGYSKFLDYDALIKTDGSSQSVITVDAALSSTSTNPVQNNVINSALAGKQDTLGVITDSSNTQYYNWTAIKVGRVATVTVGGQSGITPTLPEAFKPAHTVYGASNTTIGIDGKVTCKGVTTTITYITAS